VTSDVLRSLAIPEQRVRVLGERGDRPIRDGAYVLYWMVAQRRTRHNFAIQHAAWRAAQLGKPLLVLEALRLDYPYARDRFHHFVLDGMADNAASLAAAGVRHLTYVERSAGAGRGLLAALAERACVVVSDEFPCGFIPRMQAAAASRISARLELVDANGIIPLRAPGSAFTSAHALRRYIQRDGHPHLLARPLADPLAELDVSRKARVSADIGRRWPLASTAELAHAVSRAPLRGGSVAAAARLRDFVGKQLASYAEGRNHPDEDATSGLSPYLHFGHIGAHEVVAAVLEHEGWDPGKLGDYSDTRGARSGWWGVSENAEAFLDQVITWRELGYQHCWYVPNHLDYASLPAWARATLDAHRRDVRPERYSLPELEHAQTRDPIWNAAQRQLVGEGCMHNYLRMLWGKKLLEWSATPEQALERMLLLNDKYALDGRDPNSISGIFWVLGRFDRARGPERPIFGKVRYMSSSSTRRKLRLDAYLERWGR
jgi:deoxyribodipyrimidine photo-lyase